LTAALTASLAGLQVIVLEHSPVIGGTSARSSGTVWVPDNLYLRAAGVKDDLDRATRYLAGLIGEQGNEAIWRTFLNAAPRMLEDLKGRGVVGFRPYMTAPDYRQDVPGAAAGGRPLEPLPFDGRLLRRDFERLAMPLPELMLFGGLMVTRGEAAKLLRADRSLGALTLGLRLLARYVIDRSRFKRGTRLVLGNALIARLFYELRRRDVDVVNHSRCKRLRLRDNRVAGVDLAGTANGTLWARRGVVLAGGGFPASAEWRERYLPKPVAAYTAACSDCDGSTLRLALDAGAALGPEGYDNALWFPSSIAKRDDGSTAVYPHIVLDRAKPGLIAVDTEGRRFVNEAVSYHEFVRAMYRSHLKAPTIPAWLICDRAFVRRYGIGLIRPRTPSLRRFVQSGYIREARTIAALAARITVPAKVLEETVERSNSFATQGRDHDFGKGDSIHDQNNGDRTVTPNPCLGKISKPPFYALPVVPTPLGTSLGLRADTSARVLTESGEAIEGLYVCGNDMQSAFGGEYPGAGAQLGQAMTFAWIAARHAAGIEPTQAPQFEQTSP
jgi:succinate dehydrogenase/fumarate reductase flavoprotein subunit